MQPTLYNETYQTPPIGSLAMAHSLDDLWSQILRSTTVRVCASTFFVSWQSLLAQTKVCDLYVAFVVQQHILRLQISVDDAVLMETAQSFDQLSSVEASSSFAEFLVLT